MSTDDDKLATLYLLDLLEIILEYLHHANIPFRCGYSMCVACSHMHVCIHACIHVTTACQHVASMAGIDSALHQYTMPWTVTNVTWLKDACTCTEQFVMKYPVQWHWRLHNANTVSCYMLLTHTHLYFQIWLFEGC